MVERIRGTELEHGVSFQNPDSGDFVAPANLSTTQLISHLPRDVAAREQYLSNGTRFYVDVGSHPEVAIGEELTAEGVDASERANNDILNAMLKGYCEQHGIPDYAFNRRVLDELEMSWGYHENYSWLLNSEVDRDVLNQVLGIHVMTRNIYTGAGMLRANGEIAVAQKGLVITELASSGTQNATKPLIVLRDSEPHADAKYYRRVGVVGGDPNMSPWATKMKINTTDLVLDALSYGYTFDGIRIRPEDVPAISRQIATDLTMQKPIRLSDGREKTSIDIQRMILAVVQKCAADHELTPAKQQAIAEWAKVLDDLDNDPLSTADRTDWAMRHRVLQLYRSKHEASFMQGARSKQQRQAAQEAFMKNWLACDFRWDSGKPEGIAMKLLELGKWAAKYATDPELIKHRRAHASPETRAALRERIIGRATLHNPYRREVKVDWTHAKIGEFASIDLKDPYAIQDERLDDVFGKMQLPKAA